MITFLSILLTILVVVILCAFIGFWIYLALFACASLAVIIIFGVIQEILKSLF